MRTFELGHVPRKAYARRVVATLIGGAKRRIRWLVRATCGAAVRKGKACVLRCKRWKTGGRAAALHPDADEDEGSDDGGEGGDSIKLLGERNGDGAEDEHGTNEEDWDEVCGPRFDVGQRLFV